MTHVRTKIYLSVALLASTMFGVSIFAGPAIGGDPCCAKSKKKNHEIRVPGFHVKGPNITVSSTTVNKNKGGNFSGGGQGFIFQGQQRQQQIIFGGGGGGFINNGSVTTVIEGLVIEGELETKTITEQIEVPYYESITRSRWTENIYVLQAVCMDDAGTPHPASRPDPNEHVEPTYVGELFRCMSGTWMQITFGDYVKGGQSHGQFNNGRTMVCGKGEALLHQRGGMVVCGPQAPRRNCNERSLLRKFGVGIKIVRIAREEQFTEQITKTRIETRTRQMTVEESSKRVRKTLVLSGGVGGGG
ncbi:MAG: hypothetical protein JKX99_01580 [Robiginitomaculum sp.]|nr:hypothetical protein [Robiginitomaculum sp.]